MLLDGIRDVVGGGGKGGWNEFHTYRVRRYQLPSLNCQTTADFTHSSVDCQWEEADALAAINFKDL